MRGKTGRKRRECSYVLSVPSACSPSFTAVFLLCPYFASARNLRVPRETFRSNDGLTRVFDWAARATFSASGNSLGAIYWREKETFS